MLKYACAVTQEMQFVQPSAGSAGTRTSAPRTKKERPDSGTIKRYSFSFLGILPFESLNITLIPDPVGESELP
jgi:hypothetical protein